MGRRTGAVLVSLLLLLTLAVSASAAAVKMTVGVRFWRESGDKESMADSAVDTTREATLTRQPNGTFTLELPVKQLSSMNMTGRLTGIAIGEGRTPQEVVADMGGVVVHGNQRNVFSVGDFPGQTTGEKVRMRIAGQQVRTDLENGKKMRDGFAQRLLRRNVGKLSDVLR